jgi:hypothetical protein
LSFISTALEKKHFPDGIGNGIEALSSSSSLSKPNAPSETVDGSVSLPEMLASSALRVADQTANGKAMPASNNTASEANSTDNERLEPKIGQEGKTFPVSPLSGLSSPVPSHTNVSSDLGNGGIAAEGKKSNNEISVGIKASAPASTKDITIITRNNTFEPSSKNKNHESSGAGSRQSGAALISLQSSAAETLQSMDFGHINHHHSESDDGGSSSGGGPNGQSASLASSRWNKIRNFTRAVRAFSEPLRRDGQPWPKPSAEDDERNQKGSISGVNSSHDNNGGDNNGIREALSQRSSASSASGESGGDGDAGADGSRHGGKKAATALSLPELLGAPPTSNEAALRWRKLRTWAKVMKHFRTQVPSRRRSFDHKDVVASELATAAAEKAKAKIAAAFAGDVFDTTNSNSAANPAQSNPAQSNDVGALRMGNATSTTERGIAPMPLLPLGDLSNNAVNNNRGKGTGVPRRRNSDPNLVRAKELTQKVLKQWMREGGQAERAKEKV